MMGMRIDVTLDTVDVAPRLEDVGTTRGYSVEDGGEKGSPLQGNDKIVTVEEGQKLWKPNFL